MKTICVAIYVLFFWVGISGAQVSVDVSDYGVHVQQGNVKVKSKTNNAGGSIGPDVQMEGVAVINGDVFIDSEKIPKGKKTYTSKKTKKTYLIHWGENGNVSVAEK